MESKVTPIIHTESETSPSPIHIEPSISSQYWGAEIGLILAIATLIRSITPLLQLIASLTRKK